MRRFLPVAFVTLIVLASQLAQPEQVTAQPKKDHGIKVLHRIPLPRSRTAIFAHIAPDGSRFGVGLDGTEVVMFDGKTGFPEYRLPGYGPVFTANGQFVATFSGTTLRVFDAGNGKELRKTDFGVNIHGMVELPGGTRYVVWTADRKAHVCAAGAGKVAHSWPFHPDSFFSWTPDGNVLFLRFQQGESYRALDVRSGKPVAGFEKILPYNRIYPPILPSGEQVIVVGEARSYLVNIKTGERVKEIPDNRKGRPQVVAEGRGNTKPRYPLDGDVKGRLRLFDFFTGKEVGALTLPDGEKSLRDHTIRLTPDGRLACVATDRSVYLLRLSYPGTESKEPDQNAIAARLKQAKAKPGPLEIALAWNNKNDLDMHVFTPSKEEIFHGHRHSKCGGHLDVDMNVEYAAASKTAVEHIVWQKKAPAGRYQVWVHHYMNHNKPDCKDPTLFVVMVKTKGEFKTFSNSISFSGVDKSKKKVVEFTIDNSGNLIIEKKLTKKDAKKVSNPPAAMDWVLAMLPGAGRCFWDVSRRDDNAEHVASVQHSGKDETVP